MPQELKPWDTYNTRGIRKKYLFRYTNKLKLIHFLTTKSLYLTKMGRFDDHLEGISTFDITELLVAYQTCYIEKESDVVPKLLREWQRHVKNSKKTLARISRDLNFTQNRHFVSCWFNSERESHSMWSYYAEENGFSIKLDRKNFQLLIKQSVKENFIPNEQGVVVGRIKYQDFPRVVYHEEQNLMKYLAFRKDESFSHEREYRVVLIDRTNSAATSDHRLLKIKNFDRLKIEVIAHPKMSDRNFDRISEELQAHGSNIHFRKSELEPFYKFRERISSES